MSKINETSIDLFPQDLPSLSQDVFGASFPQISPIPSNLEVSFNENNSLIDLFPTMENNSETLFIPEHNDGAAGFVLPVLFESAATTGTHFNFQGEENNFLNEGGALNPLSLHEMQGLFELNGGFGDLANVQISQSELSHHSFATPTLSFQTDAPPVVGKEDPHADPPTAEGQTIYGDEDNNSLSGGTSNDTIYGEGSKDTLYGGEGDDSLYGGTGSDLLSGDSGDDTLYASADGTWTGGWSAYNVETGESVALNGKTASHDVFKGGDGYDTLQMGDGGDAFFLDNSYSPFYDGNTQARLDSVEEIDAAEGDDIIDLTSNKYSIGDITIKGGEGDDTLWSSDGNDSLYGDAGNDSLYGGAGNDLLDGGEGVDNLAGGSGDDTFVFDVNDTSIDGGSGWDTVKISDGTFDFSTLDGILDNVESLDLENTTLTIDINFINNVNGQGYTMQVDGDNTSQITFEEIFVDGGTTNIDGQDYTIYTNNDTTIHVDTDVVVIMP